jgi:hypothetical protein
LNETGFSFRHYLDAFNPIGGGFPEGAVQLTAQRTIVDNDGVA